MIRMFLSYPLLSQHRDEAGKRTIETGEIRVGKAMVDKLAERPGERALPMVSRRSVCYVSSSIR